MDWEDAPEEYEAENDLQVVEVYLNNGGDFIDTIFDNLWVEEDADASV